MVPGFTDGECIIFHRRSDPASPRCIGHETSSLPGLVSDPSIGFRRIALIGIEHFAGVGELLAQVRPAADEDAGDVAVAVDDDRLRNRGRPVPAGDDAVAVEGDRQIQLVPFEQRL